MITATIFSRDRAAQLDLLLRSITSNAPNLFDGINVIWKASDQRMERAYEIIAKEHTEICLFKEQLNFRKQVQGLLSWSRDYACFLCDDDIFYREIPEQSIEDMLKLNTDVLGFSLRLGENTTYCYPMQRQQALPTFDPLLDMNVWYWKEAEFDFAYPGSLDGHIFRRDHLRVLTGGEYGNPNQLEEVLNKACYCTTVPKFASFRESVLVGNPTNRVNDTHPNRYGDYHDSDTETLNDKFLRQNRLQLHKMRFDNINGAHKEMRLVFG